MAMIIDVIMPFSYANSGLLYLYNKGIICTRGPILLFIREFVLKVAVNLLRMNVNISKSNLIPVNESISIKWPKLTKLKRFMFKMDILTF